MNTRRAIVLGCGAGALLAAAGALAQQTGRRYRVGVVFPMPRHIGGRYYAALLERLATHGFVEGRNLRIDARFVPYGSQPNTEIARELVALKPDALFTCSTLVTQAAQAATSAIPVVFAWVADPVVSGIVKDYARPGANVTGVTNRFFEIAAKRVELVRELLPQAKRIAVMSGVFDSVLDSMMVFAQRAASQLGIELMKMPTHGVWDGAIRAAAKAGAEAVILVTPFAILGRHDAAKQVIRQANDQRMPVIYSETESVELGGLMSYATNLSDDLRRGADMLARILRGDKPANLPVDQASRFELAVNLRTARASGITILQPLLLRADRVIE